MVHTWNPSTRKMKERGSEIDVCPLLAWAPCLKNPEGGAGREAKPLFCPPVALAEHYTRFQLPRGPGHHPFHDERPAHGVDHLKTLQQGREDDPAHGAHRLGDR